MKWGENVYNQWKINSNIENKTSTICESENENYKIMYNTNSVTFHVSENATNSTMAFFKIGVANPTVTIASDENGTIMDQDG